MGRRILIAEDELIIAFNLKSILQQHGYDVCYISTSGKDTIEAALRIIPDLLVVDIYLEDEVDGIDAVMEIHKNKIIPVIYTTASTDLSTFHKAEKTEMIRYLQKPYDNDAILDAIKSAV